MSECIATAPGKLMITGEYAVLSGAPAVMVAIDRRAVARAGAGGAPLDAPSPFLAAVAREIARRFGANDPAARAAVVVDSAAFYTGAQKLGLGSSAAVTVAATARALAERGPLDRALVLDVALAAHADAQGAKGARGSGADIASAVYGGVIAFEMFGPRVTPLAWPADVRLVAFFTGQSADTATLVSAITTARRTRAHAVEAAMSAIATASRQVIAALEGAPANLVAAIAEAGRATAALGEAASVPLVPACVTAAARRIEPLGGAVKTTGAGGGDVGIAVIPATLDEANVRAVLIESGCQPLDVSVDPTGVDLRSDAQ